MRGLRSMIVLLAATLVVGLVGAPAALAGTRAPAAPPRTADVFRGIAVTGTTQNGGQLTGTLDIQRFVTANRRLVAVGTLNGVVKNASGDVVKTITDQLVRIPLQADGTCRILHLTLGPIDLDLLGLQIHLSRVVLDITAQSGPGRLLGNLLCSIAHLLDRNSLTAVANQLNRLLVVRL